MSRAKKDALLVQLIRELRLASANFVMFSQATADKAGLHSTDMESLDHLLLHGPLTAGKLSQLTGLTSGTMTILIDRLETAGFVSRRPGAKDRRQVVVVPNQEKIAAEILPILAPFSSALGALVKKYPEKDLRLLLDFFIEANQAASNHIAKLRA